MDEMSKEFPDVLPLLSVVDSVIFPRMVVPLMLRDEKYSKLVDDVLQKDKMVVIAMVKDADQDEETAEVHRVGTASQVIKLSKTEEGTLLIVQGVARVKIGKIVSDKPYQQAKISRLKDKERKGQEVNAMMNNILSLFKQIADLSPLLPQELVFLSQNVDLPGPLADFVVSTLNLDNNKKQKILDALDVKIRLKKLMLFLNEELDMHKMGKEIQDQVRQGIDDNQREYFLREQLKAIQKELGMDKDGPSELDELELMLEEKALPEAVRNAVDKELDRLAMMQPTSAEYTVSRTYIDWIFDLPWQESTEDNVDIQRAEKVLNKHHYNLEKIKKRILEYLAVRKLNPDHKGPILCLVGPPGTGKTSLGRSIADAMNRKFVRMSLGGVRDEAEIRGHRRTYVGALPGRIVQGIKKAGYNNPVYVLDEIDKV
ncbi:LON peptidase substrate-binding domain-containing protein, partial [Thermodesulfobacteriota bacterium]